MKVRLPLVLVGLAIGFALQTPAQQTDTPAAGLVVNKEPFGKMPDGRPVEKFTLSNVHGMEVNIITYGGAIQSMKVPDKNGRMGDVVLGFDNLPDYLKHEKNYFSALIGRYCNRIANGQFVLDGTTYQIPPNWFPDAFHGGSKGFDKQVWAAAPLRDAQWVGVELAYFSADGEMGFPGNLTVTVRYTLNNDNELRIDYSAVTDKHTIVNLTNTTHFNLAGAGHGTILDQVAMINADKFTATDGVIPTGELQDVKGTAFDFTKPMAIGARIHTVGGYDLNWVLNNPGDLSALAVRVFDPKSGRTVEMYTTEPGVQIYTANFLDGSVKGKEGLTYERWGAFTLEAEHYPDSPNHANFPSTELKPGEKYSQTTIYKFSSL